MGSLLNECVSWDSVRWTSVAPSSRGTPALGTHHYARTLASRGYGVKNRDEPKKEKDLGRKSAANVDLTEAEQNAPTTHGTPETQLRTETGEQENLVKLTLNDGVVRTGENLVEQNLSLSV